MRFRVRSGAAGRSGSGRRGAGTPEPARRGGRRGGIGARP